MGKPEQRHPLPHYSATPFRSVLGAVVLRDLSPIHHIPPGLDVIGPAILVIEIIGVFPDIDAEQRGIALHQRAILVWCRSHFELSALVLDQPGPAAAETTGAGRGEFFLETVEASEGRLD